MVCNSTVIELEGYKWVHSIKPFTNINSMSPEDPSTSQLRRTTIIGHGHVSSPIFDILCLALASILLRCIEDIKSYQLKQ